jgi:hypothetical protein
MSNSLREADRAIQEEGRVSVGEDDLRFRSAHEGDLGVGWGNDLQSDYLLIIQSASEEIVFM